MYPRPIHALIRAFEKLPSVGARTAERFVFHLLKSGKKEVAELEHALHRLMDEIKSCRTCWNFSDTDPCSLCRDTKRDAALLCVVKNPQEVEVIERTGVFHGRYHVLRGVIEPDDEKALDKLTISSLLSRIGAEKIREVILALNPDLPGEMTMMLIQKNIRTTHPNVLVSRLAKGLPLGSDIQYADDITLESALTHRTQAGEQKV